MAGAALVALAACSSDDKGTTASTTAKSGAGGSTSTGQGTVSAPATGGASTTAGPTTPTPTPTPTGTLHVGTFTDATTFDPHQAQPTLAAYFGPVYDTLVRFDGSGNLTPGLATAWSRSDAATWKFELRDDVTFSDGMKFDATAVKANIERARDTTTNPQGGEFRNIDAVEVVSPTEVTVHFSSPHPEFASVMAGIAGSMISPAAMNESLATTPVGSGGWTLDPSASQAGVKYTFVANPDYWDPASQGVEKVEVVVLSDNTARVNAIKAKQVEVIDAVQTSAIDDLQSSGLTILQAALQNSFFFVGDRDGKLVPALADRRVRQALSYAMDRTSYIDNLQAGRGVATAALWPSGSKWANADNEKLYAFDADKAKSLLAEAGVGDGFEVTVPSFATTQTSNEIGAQMLAPIGVKLQLETIQPGTAGQLFRQGKYAMVWGPVVVTNPYSFWATFVSGAGGWNPFGVDTSAIDAIAAKAAASLDESEQLDLYGQLERQILDDGLFMSFGQTQLVVALAASVSGTPVVRPGERVPLPHGLRVAS